MRLSLASLVLLNLTAVGLAQRSSAPRPEIQAAAGNAAAKLRDQIMRMPVAKDLPASSLDRALQKAQTVGGPRWVDNHTCQVQMEISGSQLADLLMQDLKEHPESSPLSPADLRKRLDEWGDLTFNAVGSSADGDSVELAQPNGALGAWSAIDEATRKRTIAAARRDAAQKMLENISNISLKEQLHIGDVTSRPATAEKVLAWFNRQPITRVEFLEDLKVSVTVDISPSSLTSTLQSAAEESGINWNRVQQEIAERVETLVGTASAKPGGAGELPVRPPDWAATFIEAEASGSGEGSRLKVARAIETVAIGKLREKFVALKVGINTLAEIAKSDPQVGQGIDRVMMHAHTYKVDYRTDGSVLVHVSLDLRNVWDELRSNP
jgi:hypothetical protein